MRFGNVKESSKDRKFYPLHNLCSIIGENVALQLPAALKSNWFCDTIEIETKHSALQSLPNNSLIDLG